MAGGTQSGMTGGRPRFSFGAGAAPFFPTARAFQHLIAEKCIVNFRKLPNCRLPESYCVVPVKPRVCQAHDLF